MSRSNLFRAGVLVVAGVVGCAASPHLLERIQVDAGSEGGPASDGEGERIDGGDARPICSPETCPAAELVVADRGAHRGLATVGDSIVWSSNLRPDGYDVKYCRVSDCSAPNVVTLWMCASDIPMAVTGYLAAVGAGVFLTTSDCPYFCRLDVAGTPDANTPCGTTNEGLLRLVGDSAGLFATRGDLMRPGTELLAMSVTFFNNQATAIGRRGVPELAPDDAAYLALSPSRVYWAERHADATFSVVSCPRDLGACITPKGHINHRAGSPVAIAANDATAYVAYNEADVHKLVRVDVAGPETSRTLVTSSTVIGAVILDTKYAYWSEGSDLKRSPLASTSAESDLPEVIGRSSSAATHLAIAGGTLYLALAGEGIFRLPLPP